MICLFFISWPEHLNWTILLKLILQKLDTILQNDLSPLSCFCPGAFNFIIVCVILHSRTWGKVIAR